jgi:hypothetical protein
MISRDAVGKPAGTACLWKERHHTRRGVCSCRPSARASAAHCYHRFCTVPDESFAHGPVIVERAGETYFGVYLVLGDELTVAIADRRHTAPLRGSVPAVLAQVLAEHLVDEAVGRVDADA